MAIKLNGIAIKRRWNVIGRFTGGWSGKLHRCRTLITFVIMMIIMIIIILLLLLSGKEREREREVSQENKMAARHAPLPTKLPINNLIIFIATRCAEIWRWLAAGSSPALFATFTPREFRISVENSARSFIVSMRLINVFNLAADSLIGCCPQVPPPSVFLNNRGWGGRGKSF